MAALIGLVNIPVGVQTVGLAEQPLGSLGILFAGFLQRLVSGETQTAVRQVGAEAELLHFLRADVEAVKPEARQVDFLPVGNLLEENSAVEELGKLFAQGHFANTAHMPQSLLAGGHGEIALVALLSHGSTHRPDDPGGTQNVVCVAMGDKHTANVRDFYSQFLQPD